MCFERGGVLQRVEHVRVAASPSALKAVAALSALKLPQAACWGRGRTPGTLKARKLRRRAAGRSLRCKKGAFRWRGPGDGAVAEHKARALCIVSAWRSGHHVKRAPGKRGSKCALVFKRRFFAVRPSKACSDARCASFRRGRRFERMQPAVGPRGAPCALPPSTSLPLAPARRCWLRCACSGFR